MILITLFVRISLACIATEGEFEELRFATLRARREHGVRKEHEGGCNLLERNEYLEATQSLNYRGDFLKLGNHMRGEVSELVG